MTIQQLEYVLEIARTGSVTQAARNLFLSQPNISNAIRNLEAELEITIFNRTASGMVLTREGQRLVKRAGSIMQQLGGLLEDVKGRRDCYFRMNSSNYIPAFEAFTDLCHKYQEQPQLHFSCFSEQPSDLVHAIQENQYDLCVFVHVVGAELELRCRAADLDCVTLRRMPMFIQISKDHPLAQPGAFSMNALRQYPYVDYAKPQGDNTPTAHLFKFIDPNRLIRVQSLTSRRDIVAGTNAFSAVLPHTPEYNERYGLVNIPIPLDQVQMQIGYIAPAGQPLSSFAQDYVAFFEQRLPRQEDMTWPQR